ncbi:MAG: hypothetical protein HY775_08470 [Acidobacteria bacterium]|nr:hypothetical protein [Acidobacteriota bacterium]
MTVTETSGRVTEAAFFPDFGTTDSLAGWQVGEMGWSGTMAEHEGTVPANAFSGVGSTGGSAAVLRAAWAGWGLEIRCRVEVSGVLVSSTPKPLGHAVYAFPTDFHGGAAALMGPVGALWGVSLEAVQTYEFSTKGYLFAAFGTELGWAEVSGPEGQEYEAIGYSPWIYVSEPTEGLWQCQLRVGADEWGAIPALWVMTI